MISSLSVHRERKPKAPTLRESDWEPYKETIIDMHIVQDMPLLKVRSLIEAEYGFTAEISQYRFRISKWGLDKNTKTREMKAIVRKRQYRIFAEPDKAELTFEVRGKTIELEDIERWMRRHDIPKDKIYIRSPGASTPADLQCWTVSERGSPVPDPLLVVSPRWNASRLLSKSVTATPSADAMQLMRAPTPHKSQGEYLAARHTNEAILAPVSQSPDDLDIVPSVDRTAAVHSSEIELPTISNQPQVSCTAYRPIDVRWWMELKLQDIYNQQERGDLYVARTVAKRCTYLINQFHGRQPKAINFQDLLVESSESAIFHHYHGHIDLRQSCDEWLVDDYRCCMKFVHLNREESSRIISVHLSIWHSSGAFPRFSFDCRLYPGAEMTPGKETQAYFVAGDRHSWETNKAFPKTDLTDHVKAFDSDRMHSDILKQPVTAFLRCSFGNMALSDAAMLGQLETFRLLLEVGAPVRNAYRYHHSVLWPIWLGFRNRNERSWSPEKTGSFQVDLERCKSMTLLAMGKSACVEECVGIGSQNIPLWTTLARILFDKDGCDPSPMLLSAEWQQILPFLSQIGCDLESRDCHGQTLFLGAASDLSFRRIQELSKQGVNTSVTDYHDQCAFDLVLDRWRKATQASDLRVTIRALVTAGCDPHRSFKWAEARDSWRASMWAMCESAFRDLGWTMHQINELVNRSPSKRGT